MNDVMRDQPFVRDGVGYIPLRCKDGSTAAWAVVNPEDFEDVARFNWCRHRRSGYAMRTSYRTTILMHRYLLGLSPGDGLQGDHIDRDRLNNRRENLRIIPNTAASRQNVSSTRGSSSSYRGVNWAKREGKWRARGKIAGQEYELGMFTNEDEAGKAAATFRLAHMPYATD